MSAPAVAPERMAAAGRAFRYDAFISYASGTREGKGSTFDRRVGERLQRLMETYRAPRRGRGGRAARIGRVFRDRDELHATNDLPEMLREALASSRYLIVVCSPRARASRWVNREVAEFARVRGVENVLLLLIEGEPEESFPTALEELAPGVSPLDRYLAADIRGESPAESMRLLKREKLRLIAPLLNYGFDDLRQREHERKVRRLATLATAAAVLVMGLAALALALEAARTRAQASYELALTSASRIMAVLSGASPGMRSINIQQAREDADSLVRLDPRNARAVTLLRTLYALEATDKRETGATEAEVDLAYERARAQVVAQIVNRLRTLDPGAQPERDALVMPNEGERAGARIILASLEQFLQTTVSRHTAEDYAEEASKYVLLLNMAEPADRAEARRVLNVALTMFDRAGIMEGSARDAT
ncbi:MAG TPA: toll/interleukin-1 receptor domain-containing protein, partial [Longimicrobium sp.]|nr:toll/interleukin-1 receptor domain-containing protein [Longimicrobium sp.]